jgi:hypothetical protein
VVFAPGCGDAGDGAADTLPEAGDVVHGQPVRPDHRRPHLHRPFHLLLVVTTSAATAAAAVAAAPTHTTAHPARAAAASSVRNPPSLALPSRSDASQTPENGDERRASSISSASLPLGLGASWHC